MGHVTLFKIVNPINIFGMGEATLFKFGKWIDYTASPTPRVKKVPQKVRGLGHVIIFGVKPRSVNFGKASNMASATPGVTDRGRHHGCGVGHVTAV